MHALVAFVRSRAGWRLTVVAITLAAVLVRLVVIAHSHGGEDLRMYTYFSRLPLHGGDPFTPPPSAQWPAVDSNNPPGEVAVFTGLLAVRDSPTMLRLLFVATDAALLAAVGLCFARTRRWRLTFMAFYGFNPLVLFAFTAYAEDKTLLFAGIAGWLLALERERLWAAWGWAAALTVFKFLGAFAVPALALHTWRCRGRRALLPAAAFCTAFVLGNLPWLPGGPETFARRDVRLALPVPIHASPTLLLSRAGLYAPFEARLLTVAGIAAVLALFAARRIDVREAVVWAIAAGYAFLPDDAFNRLLLITLPFLLLVELSPLRWLAVWVVSCVTALGAVIATRGVPHALAGAAGPLRAIFAHESTVRHTLWMALLPTLVIGTYLSERRAGRAPLAPLAQG